MTSHAGTFGAGLTYFAVVFAAGFVFGTVRVLLLVPRLGEVLATLVELPLILWVAWIACGKTIARFRVPHAIGSRLAMGGLAFALLMVAEVIFSTTLFGRPVAEFLAGLATPAGAIGLAGQIAFALLPAIRA